MREGRILMREGRILTREGRINGTDNARNNFISGGRKVLGTLHIASYFQSASPVQYGRDGNQVTQKYSDLLTDILKVPSYRSTENLCL